MQAGKHTKKSKELSPRKQKKLEKARLRQEKELKSPEKLKAKRFGYLGIVAFLIMIIGLSFGNVMDKYQRTIDWKVNNPNAIALADQDPNLINEQNPKIRAAIMNFTRTYLKIYNPKTFDLTKQATSKNIKKFNDAYAQIPDTNKSFYKERYTLVNTKYNILKEYKSLFSSYPEILDADITPAKVKAIHDKTFPQIYQFEQDNGNADQFVKRIYKMQKDLAHDANIVDQISGVISQIIISKNKQTYTLSNTAFTKNIDKIDDLESELHYKWNGLMLTKAIASASHKTINYQIKKHSKWQTYQNDVQKHNQAIADFAHLKETDIANKQQANAQARAKIQSEINSLLDTIQKRKDRIAKQKAEVKVEDFRDRSLDYVKRWVSEHGLNINIIYVSTQNLYDNGKIFKTNPDQNDTLYRGYPGEDTLQVFVYQYQSEDSQSSSSSSNNSTQNVKPDTDQASQASSKN